MQADTPLDLKNEPPTSEVNNEENLSPCSLLFDYYAGTTGQSGHDRGRGGNLHAKAWLQDASEHPAHADFERENQETMQSHLGRRS